MACFCSITQEEGFFLKVFILNVLDFKLLFIFLMYRNLYIDKYLFDLISLGLVHMCQVSKKDTSRA